MDNVLAMQACGLEIQVHPCKTSGVVAHAFNARAGEAESEITGQAAKLNYCSRFRESLPQKNRVEKNRGRHATSTCVLQRETETETERGNAI